MNKVTLIIFMAVILTSCGPRQVSCGYRRRGLTKGQQVKNNLLHAKRGKKLEKIINKIIDPKW